MDLNLLRVFLNIHDTRSVSRAAEALGMHQSAVSRALAVLRADLQDALFVRTAHGMEPTPAAQRLAEPLREALRALDTAVQSRQPFEPSTTDDTFRILAGDIVESAVLTFVTPALTQLAPRARMHFVSRRPVEIETALERGEIDLAIGHFPGLRSANIYSVHLSKIRFGLFGRVDHPLAGRSLTRAQFDRLRHIAVGGECSIVHAIESWFEQKGIARDIAVRTSHFYGVATLLERSDFVAALPTNDRGLWFYGGTAAQIMPPFELPVAQVRAYWHRTVQNDVRHRWWRQLLTRTVRASGAEVSDLRELPKTA